MQSRNFGIVLGHHPIGLINLSLPRFPLKETLIVNIFVSGVELVFFLVCFFELLPFGERLVYAVHTDETSFN